MNATSPNNSKPVSQATAKPDYGCDPLGNGQFRLVPSGRIVDQSEKDRLFPRKTSHINDCVGMTWRAIETKQGGKLTH